MIKKVLDDHVLRIQSRMMQLYYVGFVLFVLLIQDERGIKRIELLSLIFNVS